MATEKLYRIECITDGTYELTWSATAPTECPVNAAHTIGKVVSFQERNNPIAYPPITLHMKVEDVTYDGTFEEVASIYSRPESIVGVLANSYVYLLGWVQCNVTGGDPKFRIRAFPEGGGTATEIVPSTSVADTAGVDAKFSQFTPKNLLTGYARYVLEARLNGGTSLCFKNLTATPFEDL